MTEPSSLKRLVIVRHADRDTSGGHEIDNGLSAAGREQAAGLVALLSEIHPRLRLVASPAKRCQETMEPLAQKIAAAVQIDESLREHQGGESYREFEDRVSACWNAQLNQLAPNEALVLCSHVDWIEAALKQLLGAGMALQKGAFVVLEIAGEHVSLVNAARAG